MATNANPAHKAPAERKWCKQVVKVVQLANAAPTLAVGRFVGEWFDLVDVNKQNWMSMADFEKALQAVHVSVDHRAVRDLFDMADYNSDGHITRQEFYHLFRIEMAAGRDPLAADYVLPSGRPLALGLIVGKLRRRCMMAQVLQGGRGRNRWADQAPEVDEFVSVQRELIAQEFGHGDDDAPRSASRHRRRRQSHSRRDTSPGSPRGASSPGEEEEEDECLEIEDSDLLAPLVPRWRRQYDLHDEAEEEEEHLESAQRIEPLHRTPTPPDKPPSSPRCSSDSTYERRGAEACHAAAAMSAVADLPRLLLPVTPNHESREASGRGAQSLPTTPTYRLPGGTPGAGRSRQRIFRNQLVRAAAHSSDGAGVVPAPSCTPLGAAARESTSPRRQQGSPADVSCRASADWASLHISRSVDCSGRSSPVKDVVVEVHKPTRGLRALWRADDVREDLMGSDDDIGRADGHADRAWLPGGDRLAHDGPHHRRLGTPVGSHDVRTFQAKLISVPHLRNAHSPSRPAALTAPCQRQPSRERLASRDWHTQRRFVPTPDYSLFYDARDSNIEHTGGGAHATGPGSPHASCAPTSTPATTFLPAASSSATPKGPPFMAYRGAPLISPASRKSPRDQQSLDAPFPDLIGRAAHQQSPTPSAATHSRIGTRAGSKGSLCPLTASIHTALGSHSGANSSSKRHPGTQASSAVSCSRPLITWGH